MEKESKEQRAPPLRVAPPERDFPCSGEAVSASAASRSERKAPRLNPMGGGGLRPGSTDASSPEATRTSHPAVSAPCATPQQDSENQRSRSVTSSPEKEDRCYATRGSLVPHGCEGENGAGGGGGVMDERGGAVALPRFFISLSNKEKEEDFMAMKGCKLPQRPKKRSKYIQKCILLVSPGTWLPDLSQERYEVREKKGSRKRKRGLKAMSLESDSE